MSRAVEHAFFSFSDSGRHQRLTYISLVLEHGFYRTGLIKHLCKPEHLWFTRKQQRHGLKTVNLSSQLKVQFDAEQHAPL